MAKQTQVVTGNDNANIMLQHNAGGNVKLFMNYIAALEKEAAEQYQDATNNLTEMPESIKVSAFQKWIIVRDVYVTAKNLLK